MYTETGIMQRKTVAEMVESYNSAIAKVANAYTLLETAQLELESVFGKHYGDFSTIDRDMYHSNSSKENIAKMIFKIKKSAWKRIIEQLGIKKVLSIKRAEEFDKKLDEGKDLPEITDTNILSMMESLVEQSKDYATEAVKEVFEFLRPGAHDYNKLKTNAKYAKYELGKKVILSWCVEHAYSKPFRVHYGQTENKLVALDRVFGVLDGKPWNDSYKSPLVDAINTSETGSGETEYFKFRACHNGNLHLEFKRMDLVQKMNQIAGNEPKLRGN
jgi:NAD-dependent DNA ligase